MNFDVDDIPSIIIIVYPGLSTLFSNPTTKTEYTTFSIVEGKGKSECF